uniref:Uncharacterized protein n=1 Tax=viral metagenome TaxID=1070528 RepID=A0A6C0J866_9ZZZZ
MFFVGLIILLIILIIYKNYKLDDKDFPHKKISILINSLIILLVIITYYGNLSNDTNNLPFEFKKKTYEFDEYDKLYRTDVDYYKRLRPFVYPDEMHRNTIKHWFDPKD